MPKFLVLGSVSFFRYKGATHLPGDVVELPDSFLATKPDFLQPLLGSQEPVNMEAYLRKDRDYEPRPLMMVMAVRRIPEVQKAFKKLTFLDKVFFKNYPAHEISAQMNEYIADHGEGYTHFLISSDDITPSPANIHQLVDDVRTYDLPVVAGLCNICHFDKQDKRGCLCGCCVDEKPHKFTNVTFSPVRLPLSRRSYDFVTREWALLHPSLFQIWFQGNACGMIREGVIRQLPLRSFNEGQGGLMQDLAMAMDLAEHGIPQFVDFRVTIRHYGTHHGRLLIGKEKKAVIFEPRKCEKQ